jgi:5-methylthioadenosine/S-adenosylhomocysteine deaminase
VVGWATRGGTRALGLDSVAGSREPGKKADLVLIKNGASPVMFPLLNPYGHVAFQAQRGDEHTVLVNGREIPETKVLDDPYTYTSWDAGSAQWKGGGRSDTPA